MNWRSARVRLWNIGSIRGLVSWDQQVNMPPKGVAHRAEMLSYLAQELHRKSTDPRIGELLAEAEQGQWTPGQAANLREWRRAYDQASKLPADLVRRRAELTAKANTIWQEARAKNDFPLFAPYLGELVTISRETADHLGWQAERYDALLDQYEPDLTTARCEAFFDGLRKSVVPLLERIVASPVQADRDLFRGAAFPEAGQRDLGIAMTRALGFDYEAGRLDIATHPFCSGFCVGDVRLTTRYDTRSPFQSLMGTIHESGHGMYDQGLAPEHEGTPLGDSISLGIHESQSRFFENNIGRSQAFWLYWFPMFRQTFLGIVDHVGFDDLYRLLNDVRPTLIRVEADEVTYNLHIMARFEIDRDLFHGDVRASRSAGGLERQVSRLFGHYPAHRPRGGASRHSLVVGLLRLLPDLHAGHGLRGAARSRATSSDVPDLDEQMAAGEFTAPLRWMREHVHRLGMLYRPADLITHATGKPPSADDYVAYLVRKYGALYRL